MSSEEPQFNIGGSRIIVVKLTILSLLYGISLPLFVHAIVKLKRRGLGRRPSQVVLWVCIINMTLLLLTFGVTIAITLLTLDPIPLTVMRRYIVLIIIQQVTMQLIPLIGDAVVIWRAVALYTKWKWKLIVLCVSFLVAIGLSLWNFVRLGQRMSLLLHNESEVLDMVSEALDPSDALDLFFPFSMATNATATYCIWHKLWSYRKEIRSFGLQTKQSSVDKILVLLVESGVVYGVLQLVNMLTTTYGGLIVSSFVFPVYFVFTAMYPSMVVVFVSDKRSVVEEFITSMVQGSVPSSHERRPATFGHLSFSSSSPQGSSGGDLMFHPPKKHEQQAAASSSYVLRF